MNLGNKIRELRRARNLTQEQLAASLNISAQAVSKWEMGASYPDMTMIPTIASLFKVSLDELNDCLTATPSAEEDYLTLKVVEILNTYLKTVPRRKELIFVCRYYYADKISNIAKMLGVSENTVFRDLAEIRSGLKEALKKEGYFFE